MCLPSVSFSYAPDFGASHYGYYETYQKTDREGNVSMVEYSPYSGSLYGVPSKGKTGMISMDISNNIEMKIKSDDDSTGFKKISIIDELGASMSYNFATDYHPWSDLYTRLRLKLSKSYTLNLNATFATYAYDVDSLGRPYIGNHTEYSRGRFGRFKVFPRTCRIRSITRRSLISSNGYGARRSVRRKVIRRVGVMMMMSTTLV